MTTETPGLRKAYGRYAKAVKELELATLAQWDQEDVVLVEQEHLARRKDAVRELVAEVELRRDALVEAVGRVS